MAELSLQNKLLNLLYHNTRNYKKPAPLNMDRLSEQWDCTPEQLHNALTNLIDKGQVRHTDLKGNPYRKEVSAEHLLIRLILDNRNKLPWDKASRIKTARRMGIKLSSIIVIKRRLNPILHTEYDDTNHPIQIILMDECDGITRLPEGDIVPQTYYGHHYYKYVRGYSRRPKIKPVKAPKPPQKFNAHRLCEYVVARGGAIYGSPRQHWQNVCSSQSGFDKAVRICLQRGLLQKTATGLQVLNAGRVASFLEPFSTCLPTSTNTNHSLSSGLLSKNDSSNVNPVTKVTVFTTDITPFPPKQRQKAVALNIFNLLVREKLRQEIAFRLLRYPRNYEKGRETIRQLYRDVKVHDEQTEEARRQQQGAMWGKQKAICLQLLSVLQEHLGISGLAGDALAAEMANRYQAALPTVEFPDNDLLTRLGTWADDTLPDDDCDESFWAGLFMNHSGSQLISEFVCRGGIDLLLRIMQFTEAEEGMIKQRAAWDVISYICHIERHKFNPKYPEQFQSISDWNGLKMASSFSNGLVITDALYNYMGNDHKLGSLLPIKPLICKAILEMYPVKGEDGETYFTSAWQENYRKLGEWEECEVLEQWIGEEGEKPELVDSCEIAKFTVKWFETKLKDVEKYGLPGDIDLLAEKITALKRWPKVSVEEQKDHLVPILNKPSRYVNAQLDWAEWSRRAEASAKGVITEWTEPTDW